jgi:nitroreductase
VSKPVSNDVVERQLNWRYATKFFDPQLKISDADWTTLEQTLVLTPSSFGLQPWHFFVVTDPEIKARLKPASWNQAQIVDASHVVVFAIKENLSIAEIDRYVARTAEVRGVSVESLVRFRQMMVSSLEAPSFNINEWATRQVYIALGFFMSSAAMLGIDSCPIEGFEPPKYDQILGLTALGYRSTVVAAAGYRSKSDKGATLPKVRFKIEDVITRV